MKKLFFLVAFVAASVMSYADGPRAIGANLGYGSGFSYQHGFGEKNMLDVEASVPLIGGFGLGGHVTYDWIDPFNAPVPWNERGEWHWTMGVGGGGGIYAFSVPLWYAGIAGHVGIAYDFWFPMELSLDWRPTIGVDNNDNGNVGFGIAGLCSGISLGIRYLF